MGHHLITDPDPLAWPAAHHSWTTDGPPSKEYSLWRHPGGLCGGEAPATSLLLLLLLLDKVRAVLASAAVGRRRAGAGGMQLVGEKKWWGGRPHYQHT